LLQITLAQLALRALERQVLVCAARLVAIQHFQQLHQLAVVVVVRA
jgi:hypothetical protein